MIVRLFHGIKRYTIDVLDLDRMSEKYHILAVNYIFLMIYATLEVVFVNTLLYRVNLDISIVLLYRGIAYVTSALAMQFAAYIGHIKSPVIVIRLGGAFYLLMYAVLFFGMDYMHIFMYPSAILTGIGGAFYWSGHNQLIPSYTTAQNRDVGISILCIIQGVSALLVPIISGAVISAGEAIWGSAGIGYRVMFGAGMITVIAQVRYQRKLPPVTQPEHKSEIRTALKLMRRDVTYRYTMCFEFLRGFRDGTFGFMLNMILFVIITSESLVGVNAFLTGVMSIAGAWAYGKLCKVDLRTRYVMLSTSLIILFCVGLLFIPTAPMVMLFAMVNSFFVLFITNAAYNTAIDVFTRDSVRRKCIGEIIAIREIFMAMGRVGGLCLIAMFLSTLKGQIWAMLLLTISQYLLGFFISKSSRILRRKQSNEAEE